MRKVQAGGQSRPPLQSRTRTVRNGTSGTASPTERYRGRPLQAKRTAGKEALRKEVSPSAFVVSRNDWIVGKKTIILEGYKMERYIYNEKNGLWYELQGDYYLPCLKLPKEETAHIGIFGQRHRRYLKTHRKALYTSLFTSGKLNGYLADINRQAEDMYSRLVKQMAEAEGVNEELKSTDQMVWVQRMNNIRNRVSEIISEELIYR